jgi:uncharacterized SAM-binding protein YcdF (DUF218 family)
MKKTHALILALALAALWLSGLFFFVRDTAAMTPTMQEAKPLDAIVVLTGGTNRLEAGFDLLKMGAGRKLFISGVYRGVEVRELMKLFRQQGNAKIDCCVELGGAENTVENARETVAWLRQQKFDSFYLVTANYHMKRALLEFDNAAKGLEITPWPVAPDKLDMHQWWRDDVFRSLIVREYSKYLLALLRGAVMKGA